jgi:prepilin-type N-terminal cleavage/methylation domain-containing protein
MRRVKTTNGFTLMELLTVVAILAILMMLLFPTFKSAKENARKTACMSNLHTIASALQQYQLDNHRYPRCLLGYYKQNQPMTSCTDGLYPEYVRSIKDFTCESARSNVNDKVTADVTPTASKDNTATTLDYYAGDSYDWTNSTATGGPIATYLTIWAYNKASVAQYTVCDGPDDPDKQLRDFSRQMRFRNVDSTAVVTWCTNHRSGSEVAEVLFLNGTVVPVVLDKMTPTVPAPSGSVLWRMLP